jgi:hypothetical protein
MKKQTFEERIAHWRALTKLPLTAEEKARWEPMLHTTWQAIGGDAEQAMHDCGGRLTKAIIVEYVIDANRVQHFGGMTNEEYDYLCQIADKPAVKRWLYQVLNY